VGFKTETHQSHTVWCVHCLGVTSSGLYCVRFGLVTADTDLEELIAMVYANGKEVEESSKVCGIFSILHTTHSMQCVVFSP